MISVRVTPRGGRGGISFGDELREAARPLVRGLAAAAVARAAAGGRVREQDFELEAGTRIDVQVDADELVEALRTAAVDGLRRFLDGFEEGLRALEEKAEGPSPKPRRKAKAKPGAGRKRRRSAAGAPSSTSTE